MINLPYGQMPPSTTIIWGAPGTIKSTLANSWPNRKMVHEFDVGGFTRGARFITPEELKMIDVYPYPAPLEAINMNLESGAKLSGWAAEWNKFTENLLKGLRRTDVATHLYDTGTKQWMMCHRAYLETMQHDGKAGHATRQSLTEIEYGDVNPWMASVLGAPKSQGRHLVVVCYSDPIRETKLVTDGSGRTQLKDGVDSGFTKPAGWRHMTKDADLILHISTEDGIPYAILEDHTYPLDKARIVYPDGHDYRSVKLGFFPLGWEHFKVPYPTYDRIEWLVEFTALLLRNHEPPCDDWDEVVAVCKQKDIKVMKGSDVAA